MKTLDMLKDNKGTTIIGGGLSVGSIILSLLPAEVRDGCMTAVMNSENPLFSSILLVAGIILLVIGPSIMKRNGKEDEKKANG